MEEERKVKKISQEDIERFIEGHDPQERIVNLEYSYQDDFITVIYRDENDQKCRKKEKFYPFCWATRAACERLCHGDRNEVSRLLRFYEIGVKKLSQTDVNGVFRHEFDDGYLFMFYAKKPMSYSKFLQFFKKCDNPVFSRNKEEEAFKSKSESKQYLIVTPQEQFLISSGKRFFKGYDDYDQVLKLTFDLETTGLDTEHDRINQIGIKFNRPFPGRPNGFEKILTVVGDTEEEKDECELWAIEQMFKIIYTFKPDIITAHNGENFDWNMIIGACKRLKHPIEEFSAKYFGGDFIHKEERESILKMGGEMETFHATVVPGVIVTDSLHAVRRAQALDSNMLKADLKYVTEYSKMKKPNRVYVPGDKIFKVWKDKKHDYAFCEKNGDWYLYNPDKNDKDTGEKYDGRKSFIPEHGFIRKDYELKTGKYIVERYLLDDLYECDRVEYRYNTPNFLICKMLPVPYKRCTTMGTAVQWKALMLAWSYEQGLAIPMFGETKAFTGGLSRLLRTGYVRKVIKLDYNSLYPSIILTWGITDPTDLMMAMLHMLEYVLNTREKFKGLKKKAGKEKEKYKKKIEEFNGGEEELQRLNEILMKYASEESFNDKKQLPVKVLQNGFFGSYGAPNVFPFGSLKCAEQTTCTGRQCLRLMISHFKKLGYEPIVGDTDGFNFQLPDDSMYRYTEEHPYVSTGESRETEKGKEYVGFRADVAEFNDMYMKDFHYSSNAVNKMGLGIDEVVESTINFSRKNYADYFPDNPYPEDVKLVGNTIKSKKMPEYIAKFLAIGIRLLLKGKGQEFLDEYYKYVEKIYNYQIPLRDIATKGKVKKSIKEYKKDVNTLTKAGRPKSRQAWYELAIANNLNIANGDTIYYVNTGKSKSHADVKKLHKFIVLDDNGDRVEITKEVEREYKKWSKTPESIESVGGTTLATTRTIDFFAKKYYPNAFSEDEIVLNCVLVPRDIIDKEEDTFCSDVSEELEYNVPKYVDMFNKRITPLLVCFSKEIRNNILIENPKDRPYFTEEQCELVSGEPNKPSDQDTYEQLMTMEDKEIKFWTKYDLVPPFFEECGMGNWEDTVADYKRRMKEEKERGIEEIREKYRFIILKLTREEIDKFYEEGEMPKELLNIVELDPNSSNFISKLHKDVVIGNMDDFIEVKNYYENKNDEY